MTTTDKRVSLPAKAVKLLKFQRTAAQLGRARAAKSKAEARVRRLDKELQEVMGEAHDSLTTLDGTPFAKRVYQSRRNIDMEVLAARYPEAYQATLSTTTSSWVKIL
jgi:hypothetical protein